MALHTLLGANGTIATALIPVLQQHNESIRLVSRNPVSIPGTEFSTANMLDKEAVSSAIAGSDIVYLLVGITYDAEIWQQQWPVIMQNVIDGCKQANAKLIFFDDVYMYGKVEGEMTETTPYRPSSNKGKVRADLARMLEKEMEAGTIKAIIARAVDFYGPGVTDKSAPGVYVFSNLVNGKKAQWPINANVSRSFTYVPDAVQALYLLSTQEQSFGQVWHLPSAQPGLTGKEFVSLAAWYMESSDKVFVLPKWVLKMIGWFSPFMKEAYEMNYQDEFPFRFNSSKFQKAFNFTPTPHQEAIKTTAKWYLENKKS